MIIQYSQNKRKQPSFPQIKSSSPPSLKINNQLVKLKKSNNKNKTIKKRNSINTYNLKPSFTNSIVKENDALKTITDDILIENKITIQLPYIHFTPIMPSQSRRKPPEDKPLRPILNGQLSSESRISNSDMLNKREIISGYGYMTHQGLVRNYNEDNITVERIKNHSLFFGIYDGHGGNGCSLYLKNYLHNNIEDISYQGIYQAIKATEQRYFNEKATGSNIDKSGSCAICAIISDSKCYIVNVGDSRAIVVKNNMIVLSTIDHKPCNPYEKDRVINAGGKVYQMPQLLPLANPNIERAYGPYRVSPGRLSVSRTIGDIAAKNIEMGGNPNVVISDPDIFPIELTKEFEWIILGSDGIFDVLSNEEILQSSQKGLKYKLTNKCDISQMCGYIAKEILKEAMIKESYDNVSCVVIAINPFNNKS